MGETLEERLARAREALREQQWVAQRLKDAHGEQARIAQQLAAIAELVKSEQADVERASGFFRRLFGGRSDLTREQQELAAVKLQQEALAEEQQAVEVDLAQLTARAKAVAGAGEAYAKVLAEAEAGLKSGPHGAKLIALAETEGKVRGARKEVEEAINAGRAAFDALTACLEAAKSSYRASIGSDLGASIASDLGAGLVTTLAIDQSEQLVHEGLRKQIASAQHLLLRFQQECRDVAGDVAIDGYALTPLPGLAEMIVRDLVWTNIFKIDDVEAEMALMSSYVSSTTMELRGRADNLAAALADVGAQRAAIVDPARERL